MKNELILFVVVGVVFGYFLLGFIRSSEGKGDDTVVINTNFGGDTSLQKKDIIGRNVIDLSTTSESLQSEAWLNSALHNEFMDIFPNFTAMREFATQRVEGEPFQQQLLDKISEVEDDFFSGRITEDVAKKNLDIF